jgi:hypothetical protein
MPEENMRQVGKEVVISTFLILFLAVSIANGQQQSGGNEPYTPSKIEWATLELQALYGKTSMTAESPLTITFIAQPDKSTILCLFQYTQDYPAAELKADRDSINYVFSKYKSSVGWPWLRLKIEERSIAKTWPK